jgi:hypothetical protein
MHDIKANQKPLFKIRHPENIKSVFDNGFGETITYQYNKYNFLTAEMDVPNNDGIEDNLLKPMPTLISVPEVERTTKTISNHDTHRLIEEYNTAPRSHCWSRRYINDVLVEYKSYRVTDDTIYKHFYTNNKEDLNYLIDKSHWDRTNIKQIIYQDNQIVSYEDSFGNIWNDSMKCKCPFQYMNIDVFLNPYTKYLMGNYE